MKKNNYSFRMRSSYWFDNTMAQGFWPKVRLLLIVTLVFVLLVGFLAALFHGSVRDNFIEDFIRSFMYSLGKGGALSTEDANTSIAYFLLMFLTILYCMFFSAILIGLISNALRTKVDELGKGNSIVLEEGHTLILGFNDTTFVLLDELIKANMSQAKPQPIVILGGVEQNIMLEQIHKRIGKQNRKAKTRIICRTGSIYSFNDLKRCSIETARAVIINEDDDFEAVKATMACSHILNESTSDEVPFLISVIQNEENLIESKLVTKGKMRDKLIVLALNEVLARIMVHTSRQPGLSDVFTEVLNYSNDEFYIFDDDPCFDQFYGKSIAEINHCLRDSFAVGVKRNDKIMINEPLEAIFEEGDSLIVVKEDDTPFKIENNPRDFDIQHINSSADEEEVKVLIIGVEDVLNAVLFEYGNYLSPGSSICIVDRDNSFAHVVEEVTLERLRQNDIDVSIKSIDLKKKKQFNALLSEYLPNCVLVLVNEDAPDPNAEDEFAMRTLIYLREYRDRLDHYYSITCEMLQSKNKELAAATGYDDFIISRQISALLMTQISQNKYMAPFFKSLLSSVGFEIYMKPAKWYLPVGKPIDLLNAGQLVAERGEILIGLRQKKNEHYEVADINPVKYEPGADTPKEYVFQDEDYIVVLSEDNKYSEVVH